MLGFVFGIEELVAILECAPLRLLLVEVFLGLCKLELDLHEVDVELLCLLLVLLLVFGDLDESLLDCGVRIAIVVAGFGGFAIAEGANTRIVATMRPTSW